MKQGRLRLLRGMTILAAAGVLLTAGCGKEETEERIETDFTVMTPEELPEELLTQIEANKKNEIRMSWEDGDDLYLIRGYGEQATGGYSIAVAECSEDEDSVLLDVRLIGPEDEMTAAKGPSYPYLVVKIGNTEKEIIIE